MVLRSMSMNFFLPAEGSLYRLRIRDPPGDGKEDLYP